MVFISFILLYKLPGVLLSTYTGFDTDKTIHIENAN